MNKDVNMISVKQQTELQNDYTIIVCPVTYLAMVEIHYDPEVLQCINYLLKVNPKQ